MKEANLKRLLIARFQPCDILKRENYKYSEKISGCQRLRRREGRGRMNGWNTEDSEGSDNTPYDIKMMDIPLDLCPNPQMYSRNDP